MSNNMPAFSPLSFTQNTSVTHQHVATCTSTNTVLLQDLASGKINNTKPYMLTADMQTSGRGQHTRSWQSPVGNIYLSLYHPLQVPLSGLLSLVIGYHLTQLPIIQQLNRQRYALKLPSIGVKWANDIGYYQLDSSSTTSFYKLAGILIEPVISDNKIIGIVVGVGINISASPILCEKTKEGMDYQAISLSQIVEQTRVVEKNQAATSNSAVSNLNNSLVSPNTSFSKPRKNAFNIPRAKDLYTAVSASLLRAISQFSSFTHNPYALSRFINDYESVNVLSNRQVYINQMLWAQASATQTQALQTSKILQGVVQGINADGSLKIRPIDAAQAATTIDIYTGTIRLIGY
ncbi:biotin--[acetyl-CoA-carboxylase] ligase [Psychrobacter lutiphocae]|uniref:biotin--[acetyl-CoA-carboxylase] ligase n=1 Tax=Psychrobacter lutiphocae TaxID=540500 RepID=UPI001D10B93D|nr:ligase [Psychrobacter lutiphocae]